MLHDWDDGDALTMLTRTAEAASARPGARVIVVEGQTHSRPRDDRATRADLLMLALTPSGRERTTTQVFGLAASARLRHDGSPDGGQGLDGDEIIGWASYDITIDATGPPEDYASYKGPLYSERERENARFRTDKVRTPYTGAGTLTLPMLDEPLTVVGCEGDEIMDRVFVTQPAAVVSRGQYPAEFTCAVQTPEATIHVMVHDRTGVGAVVPDGSEDASMFGSGGVFEERTGLVAELEMYDGDWNPLDPAFLAATLDVTRRSTVRHAVDGTRYTYRIDHLSVAGTVRIGDRDWTFTDCDGIRLHGHTITEPARANSR